MKKEQKEIIEQEKNDSTEAFNNMPFECRKVASEHMIHDHILHFKQMRQVAVRNHKKHLKEIDDWIKNLERSVLSNARTRKTKS